MLLRVHGKSLQEFRGVNFLPIKSVFKPAILVYKSRSYKMRSIEYYGSFTDALSLTPQVVSETV